MGSDGYSNPFVTGDISMDSGDFAETFNWVRLRHCHKKSFCADFFFARLDWHAHRPTSAVIWGVPSTTSLRVTKE